jgi:DNA processing protein
MTTVKESPIVETTVADLLGRSLNQYERKYAPDKIYVKGVIQSPLPSPRVSIVGSRKASDNGLEAAKEIAKTLVKEKVIIVSGLAEGIDTSAHESAIDNGGKTIAVIGTSLDKSYPQKNRYLQQIIMQYHLVISQFPIGYPIQKSNFVIRNRTMALISDATIIVEAGDSRGSLHQGWEAIRLNRSLFIWKTIVEDSSLKWPKQMMSYGAIPLYSPKDLIESLPSELDMPNLI